METIAWVFVELLCFQTGKWVIFLATLGKLKPTMDDKPINSNLVSLIGFVAVAVALFLLIIN